MKTVKVFVLAIMIGSFLLYGCSGSESGKDVGGDDPIYQECGDDIWCYHDKVVELGDPDKCEDILKYWNDNDKGVVGSCYYEIARKTGDCSLCDKIEKADIRDTCVKDVC